jgi:hypothetical protein
MENMPSSNQSKVHDGHKVKVSSKLIKSHGKGHNAKTFDIKAKGDSFHTGFVYEVLHSYNHLLTIMFKVKLLKGHQFQCQFHVAKTEHNKDN